LANQFAGEFAGAAGLFIRGERQDGDGDGRAVFARGIEALEVGIEVLIAQAASQMAVEESEEFR